MRKAAELGLALIVSACGTHGSGNTQGTLVNARLPDSSVQSIADSSIITKPQDGSSECTTMNADATTPARDADVVETMPDATVLDAGMIDASAPDAMVLDAGVTGPPPLDLTQVNWLHTNVSSWPVTSNLSRVTFPRGQICLQHNQANAWPIVTIGGSNPVEVSANPWVFIHENGQWYGGTWEWLRPAQTCKNRNSVAGDHIKRRPFDAASGWRPSSGQVLYFMVSGLARGSERNAMQRSNPVRVVWP